MSDESSADAVAAFERGHLALAFERMERLLADNPEDPDALWRAGDILWSLHRFEEAEERLGRAIQFESRPDHRAIAFGFRANARSSLWRLDRAEADIREAMRLDPADLLFHLDLGRLHVRAGREGVAEEAFRRAAACDRPDGEADAHLALARLLRAQRRYGEAREHVIRVAEIRGLDFDERALSDDLDRVIEIRPELEEARGWGEWVDRLFGGTDLERGPAVRAEIGERCIRDPEAPLFVYAGLAGDLLAVGRNREVLALLERAPGEGKSAGQRILLSNAGRAAAGLGDLERARGLFEQAIDVSPMITQPYDVYGAVLIDYGHMEEAEAVLRRGMTFEEPTQDELFYNLGQSLRSQRRYAEALECYERALELDPDYDLARTPKEDVERVLAEFGEPHHPSRS